MRGRSHLQPAAAVRTRTEKARLRMPPRAGHDLPRPCATATTGWQHSRSALSVSQATLVCGWRAKWHVERSVWHLRPAHGLLPRHETASRSPEQSRLQTQRTGQFLPDRQRTMLRLPGSGSGQHRARPCSERPQAGQYRASGTWTTTTGALQKNGKIGCAASTLAPVVLLH